MAKPTAKPQHKDGPVSIAKSAITDKPVETKEEKLIRLANRRVRMAVKYIGLVGNLAAYKPTEADITNIMSTLGAACADVENRMMGTRKATIGFTLRQVAQ